MQDNSTQTKQEVSHINEELYKKNLELALNNRTLSILRKIDELILSSVTDPRQIAQAVTTLLIAEKVATNVVILLLDRNRENLMLLTTGESLLPQKFKIPLESEPLPMKELDSPLVQCIKQKQMVSIDNQDNTMTFIYPLIIRGQPIGTIILLSPKNDNPLPDYQLDLMERLASLVGIAINDSLLYLGIENANNSLKELDKLKDEFVALASHELRNPMVSIKLYLWELLQESSDVGTLTQKQKEIINNSLDSTLRLLRLVTDMLDVSKIESGKLTLKVSAVNLGELVPQALNEITPVAQKQKITISFDKDSAKNLNILADPEKTKEVIINLLSNAIKFSLPQGKIEITTDSNDNTVSVSIKDYGRGLTPDSLSKLFQKYSRPTTDSQKIVVEGTGLGLYLSKKIIELQNGTIQAASEGENKGSTFTFTLPKAQQAK